MALFHFLPVLLVISSIAAYRLPTTIRPVHYRVHLNLTSDTLSDVSNEFYGMVVIQFTPTVETNIIQLHASHEYLRLNLVTLGSTDLNETEYSIDNTTDILTINATNNLSPQFVYNLVIDFTGNLSTNGMMGFYKSSYVNSNGVTRFLATTQFQPTSARKAFPCFDEPAFKATFDIFITYPLTYNVLSNTQGTIILNDSVSETMEFTTTAQMPTYLLAFVVSDFTCSAGEPIDQVPYRICSREEASDTRAWALDIGPRLLASLNTYTGINYNVSKAKLDQVAIPDFAAGAMENWGLVTYREIYLLYDPLESSNSYWQFIATIISHEFGHFWFGNLVTMEWWSETFLNEGMATYFEYFTTHEVFPEWQLDRQYVVHVVQSILLDDALPTALPLQSPVNSESEVMAKFGLISYDKGGSIFRMVEHFMGTNNFRTGLRNYLTTYQYSNTIPENLWASLSLAIDNTISRLPASLPEVMQNWVTTPGFPLLTVRLNGSNVIVSQRRFMVSGLDTRSAWYVPVSYTTSVDTNMFVSTSPNGWLTPYNNLEFTLPAGATWLILNNQQIGYYRVNYDDILWNRIRDVLSTNLELVHEINRAQIVDDLFNLARVNNIQYSRVFELSEFIANDTSYFTWTSAFNGFNFLLRRVGFESPLGQAMSSHILELMEKLYASVPISQMNDTEQIYTLKQVMAKNWACRLGNRDCVQYVTAGFTLYRLLNIRPNKNLRSIVYCTALRNSDNSGDWEFLWNEYLNTTTSSEKQTILTSLGCTRNETLLNRFLQYSITDNSGIRSQDASSVFAAVYNGNSVGVDVALRFLTENYQIIPEKYQSLNSLSGLINGIANRFTTAEQVNQLRQFMGSDNLPQEVQLAAAGALATAESNLGWLRQFEDHLRDYYGVASTTTAPTTVASSASTLSNLVCFVGVMYLLGIYL